MLSVPSSVWSVKGVFRLILHRAVHGEGCCGYFGVVAVGMMRGSGSVVMVRRWRVGAVDVDGGIGAGRRGGRVRGPLVLVDRWVLR